MSATIDAETEVALPRHYEVVNGRVVELPPMSAYAQEVANCLRDELSVYARSSRTGRARSDMLFAVPHLKDKGRSREPDVAFISFERWPADRPLPYRGDPMDVVPDVVVEVASPNDGADDLLAKGHEYLQAGSRLVWLIFPLVREVHAYTARGTAPRVFTDADALDGGDVLPGFTVPVADLFPPMTELPQVEGDQ